MARGQEDHRRIAEGAQRAADLEAAHIGQAHVQDHQVGRIGAHPRQRRAAQRAVLGLHAIGAQGVEDGVGDGLLVFHHQDARLFHARHSSPRQRLGTVRGGGTAWSPRRLWK
ncbi:hypothetical protein D3C81_1656610 [compost metagenome]